MEPGELDPRDILEQLTVEHRQLRWAPVGPSPELMEIREHQLQLEETLAYLHAHWTLPDRLDQMETGHGPKGFVTKVFAKLTLRAIGTRMREEQALIERLVQLTDALAKRCDQLTAIVATQQVQEAQNQAYLAGWLDATPPGGRPPGR